MRKWIIAVAALLTVPMVGAAAVIYAPAEQEQLVEGHTVFTVIETRSSPNETYREEFAAAVAVLVRENVKEIKYGDRFPGVLWFNDQYLVNPSSSPASTNPIGSRHPCGAVIAVNAGDPLPQVGGVPVVPATATYVETYHIMDPNNQVWDVDKWSYDPDGDVLTANSFLIWSVPVANNFARYHTPDDGIARCEPVTDGTACGVPLMPFTDDTTIAGRNFGNEDPVYYDNSTEGRNFRGDRACPPGIAHTAPNPAIQYNALLFFFLQDLTDSAGVKDHTNAATSTDVHGCQSGQSQWPCPASNDNAEGNSHRYNPSLLNRDETDNWPFKLSEGRGNHGGSTNCGAGNIGGGAQNQHATCNIDIYFGYSAALRPLVPNYRVFDNEGKTAPYHCHDSAEIGRAHV